MNFRNISRSTAIFCLAFICAIAIDQPVKLAILSGFRWESEALSIVLVFNKGVAFSLFASLGEWLKYLEILLIAGAIFYVFWAKLVDQYGAPLGVLLGAGCSNLVDRFAHGGVVDYVFWHYGFEFAVFNLADVLIDCSIVWIVWLHFKKPKK
ncbi:MAG: signal peptidase II [Helicobacteraceae bacterium]|jgi:signal peptidase II|nr:signal peptidase II [Helicobacteraceae bacterium]